MPGVVFPTPLGPAGDPGLLLLWLRGCTDATLVDTDDTDDTDDLDDSSAEGSHLIALDAVLDLDRAVEAAPQGSRRAVRTWIDQIAPDGRPRTARLWLDAEDRLHRLTLHDLDGELEVHLTDQGEPVELQVPDDDAVIDPTELHTLLPDLPAMPEPPPSEWDSR